MVNDTQILNNGYPMPRLGLGVYKVTDEEMETAIQAALDDGYRAFDTAYFYNNEEDSVKALKIVECLEKTCLLQLNYGTTIKVMIVRLSILIAH